MMVNVTQLMEALFLVPWKSRNERGDSHIPSATTATIYLYEQNKTQNRRSKKCQLCARSKVSNMSPTVQFGKLP